MLTKNNTRITTTLFLALSTVATACAGFEQDENFDDDITDSEDPDDGDGQGQGGDGDGDEEPNNHGTFRPQEPSDPASPDDLRAPDPAEPHWPEFCEAYSSDLFAGQTTDTGSVTVYNTETSVELQVTTDAPYQLLEVHAYVGTDPVPTTNDGSVAPGQFPYVVELAEPMESWQLSIPLAELEVGCGDQLQVAVHAVVVAFEEGAEVFEETAWAFGPDAFEVNWGWSFDYGICCAN